MPTESSFEEQDSSDEYPYSFYCDRRHNSWKGRLTSTSNGIELTDWRIREKIKTVSVSLVLCLNIGVDPPDVVKTKPCAKMECWIDPFLLPGQKALEAIGRNLQSQYEAWQPRARYRLSLDPSIEETKKLCCSLRRNAKEERILFHYNGHGVPKPTVGGEIWVFNKSYTQYIPVSIYDIQTWLGSPCIYVYDCSNAEHILKAFNKFAAQRDAEMINNMNNSNMKGDVPSSYTPLAQSIQLAACKSNQTLPMSPDLPADLFTSCLTTPITIALRWFVISNPLIKNVTLDMTMKVPGRVTDRRTPLGELNWIFTSITDTIAWSVLPTDLFLRLFRNDLMVAALFRNFLLADRIMRHFNCQPVSSPILPETHQHPMWEAWDLAADHCLSQLPGILDPNSKIEYKLSTFFSDQLSAFEVWIKKGGSPSEPPLQLPIVLQVLLSQVHRLRALLLLSKFLDFGQWAVNLALSVGIFPYVLKLLQSPALELRPVLVFIWAKLLAVDPSCRSDLLKDNGYTYFIGILTNTNTSSFLVPNISEHRAMCVFILSVFCRDFPPGQQACLANDLLPALLPYLSDQDSLLRQWTCVCLANCWNSFPDAKWAALNANAHCQLIACLADPVPEVRAGALAALGYLLGDLEKIEQVTSVEKSIIVSILKLLGDPSPLVRRELACALSKIVQQEESKFLYVAHDFLEVERLGDAKSSGSSGGNRNSLSSGIINEMKRSGSSSIPLNSEPNSDTKINHLEQSLHSFVWKSLLALSVDPFPNVFHAAASVVDRIHHKLVRSPLIDPGLSKWIESRQPTIKPSYIPQENLVVARKVTSRVSTSVSSGIFGMSIESSPQTFKRSSSFVSSLRNLVGINSSQGLGNSQPANYGLEASPRGARISAGIRRRPQSMMLAGSADFSPNGRIKSPPSEPQLSSNFPVPAKPVATDSAIAVPSLFYDWSCEYFMEPQMKIPEIDDPGSTKFNERQWRQGRNQRQNNEVVATYSNASTSKFETLHSSNVLESDAPTHSRTLLFHPYDPYLLISDQSEISIMDWTTQTTMHIISNSNPPQSSISTMKFLNEEDASILLTGSTDGVVRLYKNYSDTDEASLISAWRADNSSLPSDSSSFTCEWHQLSGVLYTSGAKPIVKIWDADEEMCIQDMITESPVSSLSLDPAGNLLLAGSINGDISLFDRRAGPEKSAVAVFKSGGERILTAKFSNSDSTEFLSGSHSGDILLWDIRNVNNPILCIETIPGPKPFFCIHDQAPLMACASPLHDLSIMNLSGRLLGEIKSTVGFLNRVPQQITGLSFHPKKLLLACSSQSSVSIYQSASIR